MSEHIALSSNHFSVDDQTADVLSFLSNATEENLKALSNKFTEEFPDYNRLTWSGSWVDTEASGVDPDYMNWVRDWIENNTPVSWEDGEPWLETVSDEDEEDAETRAEALDELVHEQASQIASDAINAGEQIEFLLSHGWTQEQVEERLDEITGKDGA